jgi:hypothetical protein
MERHTLNGSVEQSNSLQTRNSMPHIPSRYMDGNTSNSPEAMGTLLHLIRTLRNDPVALAGYLELADQRTRTLLLLLGLGRIKTVDLSSFIEASVAVGPLRKHVMEGIADILERAKQDTIRDWYDLTQTEESLTCIPMSQQARCGHLLQLIFELVARLRSARPTGREAWPSEAAASHGVDRHRLGYTASMLVEESRFLEVCIFRALMDNLAHIDLPLLLLGVMVIADEVDCQLTQQVASLLGEPGQQPPTGSRH